MQRIRQAVRSGRRIAFRYFRFDLNKERVPGHDGKRYVISPYVTICRHGCCFPVGWSDGRERAAVFRIDRMGIYGLTWEARKPAPESFNARDYAERIFNMYDEGPMETVTLRRRHPVIDHIVDCFGKNVEPFNITEETFDVSIRVCASNTFFSRVMGYAGDMTIAGPEGCAGHTEANC